MINKYGADSVRWFILSDSPPEKDIQWQMSGDFSSKFLKKFGILTMKFQKEDKESDKALETKFNLEFHQ